MTCKDFSGMIPGFLDDHLTNASLQAFLKHYSECEECREELEIQYLIRMAFDQDVTGGGISLDVDLPAMIGTARHRLQSRVRLERTATLLEAVAVMLFVLTIVMYLF